MFPNLDPLEGGRSLILIHWRDGVPESWSTVGMAFHNLGPSGEKMEAFKRDL